METIFQIPVDLIDPHPMNPRKDLGDLTELCDSIQKNGIMQNLTVVPLDDDMTRFRCVIGHRRLAAAGRTFQANTRADTFAGLAESLRQGAVA